MRFCLLLSAYRPRRVPAPWKTPDHFLLPAVFVKYIICFAPRKPPVLKRRKTSGRKVSAVQIIPATRHIPENYPLPGVEEKNLLWKLVMIRLRSIIHLTMSCRSISTLTCPGKHKSIRKQYHNLRKVIGFYRLTAPSHGIILVSIHEEAGFLCTNNRRNSRAALVCSPM